MNQLSRIDVNDIIKNADWDNCSQMSNLAKVVYRRTYLRLNEGRLESYPESIARVIHGNIQTVHPKDLLPNEPEMLAYFMLNRKASPAGRGLWYSGSPSHARLGGAALANCHFITAEDWNNYVLAMDLLMLGGGVGLSIEHRFVSKLPKIKKNVNIFHKNTKDADLIVPDSREGWCELLRRILEAFFVTGKSFSYSTCCIRGAGELIEGFGGVASGPLPLITGMEKIIGILKEREGKHTRPIDAMDILCCIGELVVSGNVRRSALLILGDPWDREYLTSKRWDLGTLPTHRAMANLTVVCDDVDDLHPLFWKTYEVGEPFGIFNRKTVQKYGRMGEKKKDTAIGTNPCVPAGTEILTSDGYRSIETLVGQTVNVWNGFEWSEVVPKVTGHDQELVRITLSTGQSLVCTKAHKFIISTGYRGTTDRIAAENLEEGMKLIKTEFPIIEKGESVEDRHAYTQGFHSGDGMDGYSYLWIYGEKHSCVERLSGKLMRTQEKQNRSAFYPNVNLSGKTFVPFCWDLNGRLNWLAGLIDSDGCSTTDGSVQITSVNQEFLMNLQKMLTITGVASKVCLMHREGLRSLPDHYGDNKPYYCQNCYRIMIGAYEVQKLKNMGLDCCRVNLDFSPDRSAIRYPFVVNVETAGFAETVYCFTESKRNMGCFEGIVTGQCGEATLEGGAGYAENCNLSEIFLPNLKNENEFFEAARLMHRYSKRVTLERYHHEGSDEVIKRNRRIGTGITGCLQSSLFNPKTLDHAYQAIQDENVAYSKQLGINESIRTTVIKPSGTLSLVGDCTPGIHPAYSRYYIRRVRFSSNDRLIPLLKAAGHPMESVQKFDGSFDHGTVVVDFFCQTPNDTPCADEGFDTWKQLDALLMAQRYWADQAISVTVYYKREELHKVKEWLRENLKNIKTISFLCHNDHGFKQAPLEAISKEDYQRYSEKIKSIDFNAIEQGQIESMECSSGVCPVK